MINCLSDRWLGDMWASLLNMSLPGTLLCGYAVALRVVETPLDMNCFFTRTLTSSLWNVDLHSF